MISFRDIFVVKMVFLMMELVSSFERASWDDLDHTGSN